jgi:hypothetical protein
VLILAATSIVIGVIWDISWHRTIGRDTFWTPAHLAIYLGGLLGGLSGGWLVLRTTFFGSEHERAASVSVWGLRAPFGAWVSIWGALAMLVSAPFDDWWHAAYGLDVKIISPPHTVLALGMWAVVWGALLLVLREQNGASGTKARLDNALYLLAAGILLAMAAVFLIEHGFPNEQRSSTFYVQSCAVYPLFLLGVARASKSRWAATWIALIYMLLIGTLNWVLPLFPGQPKLGPIYHRVDHFVALPFPLLLVAPAVVIDVLRRWIGHGKSQWRDLLLALLCAAAFVLVFLSIQSLFSQFLMSPAANNWFFVGDRQWGYTENLGPWRYQYWSVTNPRMHPPVTLQSVGFAFLLAIGSARIGLWLGNGMAKVRR